MILAHWGMPCQVVSPGNCRLRKSIFSVFHDCAFLRRNTVKNAAITPKAIPPNAAGSGHWGRAAVPAAVSPVLMTKRRFLPLKKFLPERFRTSSRTRRRAPGCSRQDWKQPSGTAFLSIWKNGSAARRRTVLRAQRALILSFPRQADCSTPNSAQTLRSPAKPIPLQKTALSQQARSPADTMSMH